MTTRFDAAVESDVEGLLAELREAAEPGALHVAALRSLSDLARNGEPDTAMDELGHVVESFTIPLSRSQYDTIEELATRLGEPEIPEDHGLRRFVF
ncbi:hypothetical protein GCM10023347_10490 [Streptomyces chumphonensis]|uniref:Uncharacterized protein n=1 Tax=Streptomyces chumphonensis TaxID=1214925 RepID=A0A927F0N4_9ACTN|nr:hypothetical protein [Streptomyces chumphonensis]MBD3933460.1 hypothetical protein [Streptomyces chumphonensis]